MRALHFRVGLFPGCTAVIFLLLAVELPGQVIQTNLAATVRHAPSLNGSGAIEGSLRQLSGENVTVSGGFVISGDLLVPGTPAVRLNGHPQFEGALAGDGSSSPSDYQVMLNGNCSVHALRTRTTPIALPTVLVPAQPSGTRSVTISSPGQAFGDAATLRHLTLGGNVGQVTVPPGNYGDFTANGGSGFTIGSAGTTEPSIYQLQNLTLNGQCRIDVLGPVILTVANGVTANGMLGASGQPSWLRLQFAAGGFTLNGGCTLYGSVTAPAGTVIVNGNSLLVGSVQCDRLIVNSGGIIRAGVAPNEGPTAASQTLSVNEDEALAVTLTGSDPEGACLSYAVLSQPGHGTLKGIAPELIYTPAANFCGSDSFTFLVSDGQADSPAATISITVVPVNDAPVVQDQSLSTAEDTCLNVVLAGSDVENDPLSFEIVAPPTNGVLTLNSPPAVPHSFTYTPAANFQGADSFTYRASDGQATSLVATVWIRVDRVDDIPVAGAQSVIVDEDSQAAIRLTAVDAEGDGLRFTILDQPAHGTLSGTPPEVVYSPATNYNGSDSFTFYASDSLADSIPATVTLEVRPVNDAPLAVGQTIVILEDTATNLVLAASDADGEDLRFELVSFPANGTLSGTAPELVFSPAANFNGTNVFQFVAADSQATSAPVSITVIVTPVNDAPVADAAAITLKEDEPEPIRLAGSDVDGDAVAYEIVAGPTNGTLSGSAPDLTYTPNTNYCGPDEFSFWVNDGQTNSAPSTVTITVAPVNDVPVADDLTITTEENQAVNGQLTAIDVEGEPLAFFLQSEAEQGSVLLNPDGTFTYIPLPGRSGTDAFTFMASDGLSDSLPASVVITITRANRAPVVDVGLNQTNNTLETTVAGVVTDDGLPEGARLSFLWSKLSGPGEVNFSDATSATNQVAFSQSGFYVLRLTASDTLLSGSADVSVLANSPPRVNAGTDLTGTVGEAVQLSGAVTDDGLPSPESLSVAWRCVSGPGLVSLADATQPGTTVIFNGPGAYTLSLVAGDTLSTNHDEIVITVSAANQAPVVSVGPKQLVVLPAVATLLATVTDDGLPQSANLSYSWSVVSGPGPVTFSAPASTHSTASFSEAGDYIVRLTANDTRLTSYGDVKISVRTPAMNEAPVVSAGPNKVIGLTNVAVLEGSVTDDGLPEGAVILSTWSVVSGPGSVAFEPASTTASQPVTRASFSVLGSYVLRLTASDSEKSASSDVTVTVYPHNQPPIVEAGTNQLVIVPDPEGLMANGLMPADPTMELRQSLFSAPRWNTAIGQPGLNDSISTRSLAWNGTHLYAGGRFTASGTNVIGQVGRWDGSNWSGLYDPSPAYAGGPAFGFVSANSGIEALAVRGDQVFVCGSFLQDRARDNFLDFTMRWDGTNWIPWQMQMVSPAVQPGPILPTLEKVYFGGDFTFHPTNWTRPINDPQNYIPGLPVYTNVAVWDGTNWGSLDTGLPPYAQWVTAMAVGKHGEIYAGGSGQFQTPFGLANCVAMWNGTNWAPLGQGIEGAVSGQSQPWVFGLGVDDDGNLYAAGSFSRAGGKLVNRIAKWDGTNWWALGNGTEIGVSGNAEVMAVYGRDVYLGGQFSKVGGVPARNIARWNGYSWSALGDGPSNGVNARVTSMAVGPAGVFIGGDFTEAGGEPANHIAAWEYPELPSRGALLTGRVSDDGLPVDSTLACAWTKASGPGEVTFADPSNPITTAVFSKTGTYLLRLSAADSEFTTVDEVEIVVRGNLPPVVSAGPDQLCGVSEALVLQGSIADDGLPEGAHLACVWSVVNGPGTVTFGNIASTNSTARFSKQGAYVLRLSANDSHFTVLDDVLVTVTTDNQPPYGYPGTQQTVRFGTGVQLSASSLRDDGKPINVTNVLWAQASGPGMVNFSNPTNPTTFATFSLPGVYAVRLNVSDTELSTYMDVTVNVNWSVNYPPSVSAGSAQTISSLNTVLQGRITDDGMPAGSTLTTWWTKASGAGTVIFANSNSPVTAVRFSGPGTYLLTLNATDGQYFPNNSVFITVQNVPPLVNAGPERTIVFPTTNLLLTATASDDGFASPMTFTWQKVSGPGTVTFSNVNALTNMARFGALGTYVLRLTANDGSTSSSDLIAVTVAPVGNQPPTVNAGPDLALAWPSNSVTVNASVTDDALPSGLLQWQWSKKSGPGTVTFSEVSTNGSQADVTAAFDQAGTYVLRLIADDCVLTNGDDVIVEVLPPAGTNQPPVVSAGPDESVIVTDTFALAGSVSDDGLPQGSSVQALWSKVSGPGPVYFSGGTNITTNLNSTARFMVPGIYVLRLTAADSIASTSDDVAIAVLPASANQAPIVSAGPDLVAPQFGPKMLQGSVSDDGLPGGGAINVNWSKISGPGTVYFQNASLTNSGASFYVTGTYVLRLTATDGETTSYDDVTVSVMSPLNEAPMVIADGPRTVVRPDAASLPGTVLDDDLPAGYPLLYQWSKVSGPGSVTFVVGTNSTQNVTAWEEVYDIDAFASATFGEAGNYVLQLAASDSQFTNADQITVAVFPGTNSAPLVNAGPDRSIDLGSAATLVSDVADDGLENGTLEIWWSVVSAPGPVYLSTLNGVYGARFSETGDYVLRLNAFDGALTVSDDVTITVFDTPPPIAELMTPEDGAILTVPIDLIGTAQSPILQSYTIEYRLKPAEQLETSNLNLETSKGWSLFASNSAVVVSNTLAVFDPTLLLNGIYELRLAATDITGRSTTTEPISVVVDRNLKIGHFTMSFSDLSVPVPGMPLQVTRTYDSRAAAAGIKGDFGIGWTMDISNVRLQKNRSLSRNWQQYTTGNSWDLSLAYHLDGGKPRIVTITFPDGRVEKFQFKPTPTDRSLWPIDYPQWRFVPIGNTRGTLVPEGYDRPDGKFLYFAGPIPGIANLYDLNYFYDWFGSAESEEDLDRYPTLFRYATPEGYQYLIDEIAGLQTVTDPNGNTLVVSTNALTWQNPSAGTNSLSVAFQRDTQGCITNIVDGAGHSMSYRYGSDGDLRSCRNRDGETNTFSYDTRHRLLTMTDSRGIQALKNAYDGNGRLISTEDAFGYSTGYFHDLQNQREFVTNRLGFVTINEYDAYGNVTRITDPLGFVSSFSYDSNGNLLVKSNASGCACGEFYAYDAFDNKIRETDAAGNTTTYTYNDLRKILTMVDPSGFGTTNTYDAAGNLLSTRDSAGQVATFAYNSLGKVTAMTDSKGTTRYGYDESGFLIALTNALGHVTEFTVDAQGNPLSQAIRVTRVTGLASVDQFKRNWQLAGDPVGPSAPITNSYRLVMRYEYTDGGLPLRTLYYDGSSSSITYENGKPSVTTDALGRETISSYDDAGRLTRKTYPDGSSEDFAYDAEGQLISSTDRRGFVTHFDYDARGKLIRTRFADGSQISATFYEDGALHTETSKSGEVTTYGLDPNRNRITVADASGITTYTYNYRNHATSKKDPLGRSTTYVYDALGRNTAIAFPDGHSKLAAFSGRLVASETDQNGNTTLYDYDPLGRLIRVTDAAGGITTYTYDEEGNKTSQQDAIGRTTYFEYDLMRRLVRTVYPDSSSVSRSYDAAGRLISQTGPMGDVTRFEYDLGDHLVASTDPLGNVTRYTYDSGGNKLTQTDPDGRFTQFEYDSLSRLIKTTFPCGTTEINTYDLAGRLIAQTDQAGKTTVLGYDIRNQLRTVTDPTGKTKTFAYDAVGNRISEVDALGQVTGHAYDALDRLVSTTFPDSTVQEFGYDAVGRMTTRLDQAGNVSRFAFDEVGRLTATSDALGQVTHFGYDAVGNRTSMTDPDGKTTTYQHDLMGRVTRTVFPDGSSQSTSYDKCGLPVTVTDAMGKVTVLNFDGAGRRTSVTDALNHTTLFAYDGAGHLISRTDANNDTTRFEYDCLGRLARTVYPDGSSSSTVYDATGQPAAATDPNGNTTRFTYDSMGRLTTQTDPLNYVTTYSYDALGRLRTRADALGRETTYDYDALGRCTRVTYADASSETFTYDARGNRVTQIDPVGNTSTFSYDALDRLVSRSDALGHSTQYSYDALSRLGSVTDPNGHTTSYTYDPLGHLIRVTYQDGSTREYAYDLQGRRTRETDQAGLAKQYRYDDAGRLIAVIDALDHESSFGYDPAGRLVTQTDANGHATHFEYNARGWRNKRILPGGLTESLDYDYNGNLTKRTSFKGNTTTYVYDARNQLIQKIPDPGLIASGAVPVSFSYTAVGRRETMDDASGTTTYSYNSMDRLVLKATPQGTLGYTYNANGSVKTITSSNPNGTSVAYDYDAAERLTTVTGSVNGNTTYTYDPAGNLTGSIQPNSLAQTYTHDDLNRLTGLQVLNAQNAKVSGFQYTLDAAGHRRSAVETLGAAPQNPQPATITRTYDYDALYRLTGETISGASSTASLTYTYDAAGNRLTRTSTLGLIPSATYSYDITDRLAGDDYDANGNTTDAWVRDPLSVLTNQVADKFDFEDHLAERSTTLNSQPSTISVLYDGDGNRVRKTVTIGTNVVTTFYLVDDRNPTGYAQVLEELTQDASLQTPAVTRVYTYGLSLLSQDQVISNQWVTSYYGVDGHGNVRYLTDTNGVITDTYDYDAFGNLIGRAGSTPNNYLFAGDQFDPDLNLYYLRARYADPDRGRFWTQDTFEGFGDDPSSWHKYTFNQNDPVNRSDPGGHFSLTESMMVSGIAPTVRGMVLGLFSGVNNYAYGLAGGSALKATSATEAYMIDSLAQGPGWQMGKEEFWATAKGAPFLLSWNPNIVQGIKNCWYECIPFDADAPVYGPAARHPIFEFEPSELYQYLEAGTMPFLAAAGVANNFVDTVKGLVGVSGDVVGSVGFMGTLVLTGGDEDTAEMLFGPQVHELGAIGTGVGKLVRDAAASELYSLSLLVAPGAAEDLFGKGRAQFAEEVSALWGGLTGGEGMPLAYRVAYGLANVGPAAIAELGKAKALASAGNLARLTQGTKALGAARKAGLLGEGGEAAKALATPAELCKQPPKLLEDLRNLRRTAQRPKGVVATRHATTEASQTLAPAREPVPLLPESAAAKGTEQIEFDFVNQVEPPSSAQNAFAYFMNQVRSLDVSTAPNTAVFYSGTGARTAAETFAARNNLITLENTVGGRWLDQQGLFNAGSPLTRHEALEVWATLSQRYAEGASGTAFGVLRTPRPTSIFNSVEYPTLLNNPAIVNFITGGQ